MGSSEALSTTKSRLAVCAAFVSVLLAHKRSELLLSHGGPVPQFRPPLSPTFPVYFIFLLYPPSPFFPTFPHNHRALPLIAPVSDSHFSRHCLLVALPTCYSLPPLSLLLRPQPTVSSCNAQYDVSPYLHSSSSSPPTTTPS